MANIIINWPLNFWLIDLHDGCDNPIVFWLITPVLCLSHEMVEGTIYILGGKKNMVSTVILSFKSSTISFVLFLGWIFPSLPSSLQGEALKVGHFDPID